MQQNVTYLLGAGASAYAFPVVKEMGKEVKLIIAKEIANQKYFSGLGIYTGNETQRPKNTIADKWLSSNIQLIHNSYSEQKNEITDSSKLNFATLAKSAHEKGPNAFSELGQNYYKIYLLFLLLYGCQSHLSIDTYAKKLWIGQKHNADFINKYRELKFSIMLFFELYKNLYNKIEKRYDALIAGIFDVDLTNKFHALPPENVNIISWNYDYLLEEAIANMLNDTVESLYNGDLFFSYKGLEVKSNKSKFNVIKMNGGIGTKNNNYNFTKGYIYSINDLLEQSHTKSLISFAWDNIDDAKDYNVLSKAKEIMAQTDVLVVIGYSFPLYNRKIDGQLLSKDNAPRLRKIYIQDSNASDIKETIDGLEIIGVILK